MVRTTADTAQYRLAHSASGGSTRVDGDRGSRPSQGRCPAPGREGAVRGRPVLPPTVGGGVRAKPPRPCPHPLDHRPRTARGPRVHRRRHGRRAPDPGRIQPALVQILRLPATRPGQGALRRRVRRAVHRSDPGGGGGHRRSGGARPRGAAGGHRQPRGTPPRRPPRTRRVGRQPVPHHLGRRRLRVGQEARRSGHRTRVPHRASMHGADGGQGGTRHARRTQGPARRVHLHPGAASHPHRALPVSRARPGGRAGHRARRGRRVRLQVRAAARGDFGVVGGDAHRPAVALGRGPARAPHRGRQHPPAPLPADRLRRRARAAPRGRRGDHGGRGRVLGVAVHRLSRSRAGRRQPAGALRPRCLSLQDVLRRDQQARLHAVSRRRAPRGVLRDGAHHRRDRACGGARAGGREGREPRAGERDALHQRHRKVLRQRRLPGQRCGERGA